MAERDFPWFPFYAVDWLTSLDLRACSLAERGALSDLMAMSWEKGGILTISPESLGRFWGIPRAKAVELLQTLASKERIDLAEPSVDRFSITIPRLEEIREAQHQRLEKMSSGGKKGAQKRWKDSSPDLFPQESHPEAQDGGDEISGAPDIAPPPVLASEAQGTPVPSKKEKKPSAETYSPEFEEAWSWWIQAGRNLYKKMAFKQWIMLLKGRKGERRPTADDLVLATRHYIEDRLRAKTEPEHILLPATFYGPSMRWESWLQESPEIQKQKTERIRLEKESEIAAQADRREQEIRSLISQEGESLDRLPIFSPLQLAAESRKEILRGEALPSLDEIKIRIKSLQFVERRSSGS